MVVGDSVGVFLDALGRVACFSLFYQNGRMRAEDPIDSFSGEKLAQATRLLFMNLYIILIDKR